MDIRPQSVKELEALGNVRIEETNGVGYSYIGLRFGHRDKATLKMWQILINLMQKNYVKHYYMQLTVQQ